MSDARGYAYPDVIDGYNMVNICIAIPDNETYRRSFFGHLTLLCNGVSWNQSDPDQAQEVGDYWTRIIYDILVGITDCVDDVNDDTPLSEIADLTQSMLSGGNCDEHYCDCEDDSMACAKPVKIGSRWYLYSDCAGCDNPLFFELSQVAIDGDGQPVSLHDGGGFGGGFGSGSGSGWGFTGVSSDNLDCYAPLAVDYLLSRASEFVDAVIDWTALGLDVFSGQIDEYIEVARLTTDLIFGTGDVTEIQNLTKDQVATVFASDAVVAPLVAAWTFTATATRNELYGWLQSAPVLASGVPVRFLLDQWLGFSLVAGYNGDLASIASQCESGNTIIPNVFPSLAEILTGNTWAYIVDFTEFDPTGESEFDIRNGFGDYDAKDDIGWITGEGLRETQDIVNGGNSQACLRFEINATGNTTVNTFVMEYDFIPEPTRSDFAGNYHDVNNTDYAEDENFSGILVQFDLGTKNVVFAQLDPDRQGGTGGTTGAGIARVKRIGIAGEGSDTFAFLADWE